MGKLRHVNGVTSLILRVKLLDKSVAYQKGKTGLSKDTAGLIISTIADVEATATAYAQASSKIETITTLGTFAAPTATKCRFKEVDATNHPGLYEIQIANARWAVSGARSVVITVSDADTLIVECDSEIQLYPAIETYDAESALRFIFDAAGAGQLSGATGGAPAILSNDGLKTRATITGDGAGNRTAVTLGDLT